jgi:hypothetical protein
LTTPDTGPYRSNENDTDENDTDCLIPDADDDVDNISDPFLGVCDPCCSSFDSWDDCIQRKLVELATSAHGRRVPLRC